MADLCGALHHVVAKPLTIGVLGGVASGKSFVARCFERLGAFRIDADELGHAVLRQPDVREAIVRRFGPQVLDASGQIDRGQLAEIVFAADSPVARERLEQLERITHPVIAQALARQIEQARRSNRYQAIVLDAAVMLKGGWDKLCDHLVFVDAPPELRQQRALQRGWTVEQFQARERSQLPVTEKRRRADAIIDNAHAPEHTERQVRDLWEHWLGTSSPAPSPPTDTTISRHH